MRRTKVEEEVETSNVVSLDRYRAARQVHSCFSCGYTEAIFVQQAKAGLKKYLEFGGQRVPVGQALELIEEFPRRKHAQYRTT